MQRFGCEDQFDFSCECRELMLFFPRQAFVGDSLEFFFDLGLLGGCCLQVTAELPSQFGSSKVSLECVQQCSAAVALPRVGRTEIQLGQFVEQS